MKEIKKTAKKTRKIISPSSNEVEVTPLKDFEIHQNEIHYILKEGEPISIEKRFLQNLITEKVILK